MSKKPKRIRFTDIERRKICEIQQKNSSWTQEQVTQAACEQLKKPGLKCTTITGILKKSAKWLKVEDSSGSRKKLCQPHLSLAVSHERFRDMTPASNGI